MNAYLSLGRWFFAIPFALLGLLHFMNTEGLAAQVVPTYMPAKAIWVYLAGAGLIAGAVSMVSGKYDKLAATLLSVFLLSLVVLVHVPAAMDTTNAMRSQQAMPMLLKDLALAGAAMMYAMYLAKDRSVLG